MSWLQLKIESSKSEALQLEALFEEIGAAAVLMEDSADQPLLEPPPGAQPLWDATRVIGVFTVDSEIDAIIEYLEARLGHPLPAHRVEVLEDKDWVRAWLDHYHPMCFGDRLWVVPSWTPPPQPNAINLLLDPGLAFGTGTHPTTALCLEWLDSLDLKDKVIIDYGCGSGILAVAALLLGAREAWCVDNDPQALTATRNNAAHNKVDDRIHTFMPEDMPSTIKADIIVANILAGPLAMLAPTLASHTLAGSQIALSGIIQPQVDELRSVYSEWFDMDGLAIKEEDWCRLSGKRR